MTSTLRLAAAALLLACTGPAWAQRVPAPVPERPPVTTPGAEPNTRIPERMAPPDSRSGSGSGSGSGSDASPGGVLSPSLNPDPGMSVMPQIPDTGTTRVIPPPGTPGGMPGAQPR